MGEVDENRTDHYLPLSLLRARLEENWTLTDILTDRRPRPLRRWKPAAGWGFITPMTHNFCESCNRVRASPALVPCSCRTGCRRRFA
ncbi:MAG: hypothetical protein R3D03_08190 [Geminicoccaceae bacterium]